MKKIYTHDEAARIVEAFDDILADNGIKVPSPEDDERDSENEAALYGSVYSDLQDFVETRLIEILEVQKEENAEVVTGVFSGNY